MLETSRAQRQFGDGLNKPPPRTHVTEEGRYLSGSREDMQEDNPRPSGIVTLPPTAELGTGHMDSTRGVNLTRHCPTFPNVGRRPNSKWRQRKPEVELTIERN